MWRDKTKLFAEAESIVSELKQHPNQNGVDAHFDWDLHFRELARAHSRAGKYSLRYHNGEVHFADPIALTVVLGSIWLAEQRKNLN